MTQRLKILFFVAAILVAAWGVTLANTPAHQMLASYGEDPLAVNITPTSLTKFSAGCPHTSAPATANASGGAGGYSYLWDWSIGGVGLTIDTPTSISTTITQAGSGSRTGTLRVTVTDAVLDTASDTISVDMECGT